MISNSAQPGRKTSLQLWGALGIAGCGAVGFALDHFVLHRADGFGATMGVLVGLTLSTYLETRGRKASHGWTALCGFVALWYFMLRVFFRT